MKWWEILLIFFIMGCAPKQGPPGITGLQGQQGVAGQDGQEGPQGPSGMNGTQITVVQLCAGYISSYPNTFPEIAECIDGKLYSVYYAPPSAGLVYLPDGLYSSTQTSAPCTFTVSGCTVH